MSDDEYANRYKDAKAKFYANPIFAAQAGIVVGVLGTLLYQWVFF